MLVGFAKLAGGLRLLVATAAPLVITSASLLSARTVAYLVGFTLGSVGVGWLAIVAALVAITGFWGAGANSAECEAYRAQMRAIDNANKIAMANYQIALQPYLISYNLCSKSVSDYFLSAWSAVSSQYASCSNLDYGVCVYGGCYNPQQNCRDAIEKRVRDGAPVCSFSPPPYPKLQTYPACSSPDCPPGKKVWTQVLWGSPSGNFSDSKGVL